MKCVGRLHNFWITTSHLDGKKEMDLLDKPSRSNGKQNFHHESLIMMMGGSCIFLKEFS